MHTDNLTHLVLIFSFAGLKNTCESDMLNAWVYYLTVEEWSDISLISKGSQFQSLNCFNESGGLVSHGWGCLFSSMPHMCVFDTTEVRYENRSSFVFTFPE